MRLIQYTEDFAELKTKSATLAIGSTRTLQLFGGEHVAQAAQNHSAIIEFRVDDVDANIKDFPVLWEMHSYSNPSQCRGETVHCSFAIRMATW